MTNFTPVSAAIGGALIGLAAVLLMLSTGRIAGISGILATLSPRVVVFVAAMAFGMVLHDLGRKRRIMAAQQALAASVDG